MAISKWKLSRFKLMFTRKYKLRNIINNLRISIIFLNFKIFLKEENIFKVFQYFKKFCTFIKNDEMIFY